MKPVVTEVINFLHELDLLEAHLDEHQHFIDRIVVVESPFSYSGMPKPLYFDENKERFARFNVEHEVMPTSLHVVIPPEYGEDEKKRWFDERRNNRERQQRYIFNKYKKDCDYICNTDVDEIWSRDAWFRVTDLMDLDYCYIMPGLKTFEHYVDNSLKNWNAWRITRSTMDTHLRQRGTLRGGTMRVGWHFSSVYKNPHDMWMKNVGLCQSMGYFGWATVPDPDECQRRVDARVIPLSNMPIRDIMKRVMPNDDISWLPTWMQANRDLWPWLPDDLRKGFPVVDDWHMP